MKQIVILPSYKEIECSFSDYTILRLCKTLSENPGINCTVATPENFILTGSNVFIKEGAMLKDGELKFTSFDPFTPDYVFFYNISDNPDGKLVYYNLLADIAERGVLVSNDKDASMVGIKSILESRCSEFELISGLKIPRPKTKIINGDDDKGKIIDFIKECGPCILKPHNSSRARGIRILNSENQVQQLVLNKEWFVLQELISNPMTIDGYKTGLRIYLIIHDLRKPVYTIAGQGLVKLAIQPYQVGNPGSEIVGSSYAKRQGFKPVMYLLKNLIDADEKTVYSWKNIRKSIEETIGSFMEAVSWRAGLYHTILPSFQFWGIDIAIQLTDEGPKAYLIEVNPFPALYRNDVATDSAVDCVLADELFAKAAGLSI